MKAGMITRVIAGFAVAATMASPLTALAAPVELPDGSVFDPDFYAEANPDVVANFGADPVDLYIHYVMFGEDEGRLPYADLGDFDAAYYAANNADVVAKIGSNPAALYQHYVMIGQKEGRASKGQGSTALPTANTTVTPENPTPAAADTNTTTVNANLPALTWEDWKNQTPAVKQFMESLGYKWVEMYGEGTGTYYWELGRKVMPNGEYDDILNYGVQIDTYDVGFVYHYHFFEGLYGSPLAMEMNDHNMEVFLKGIIKNAELYPAFSQYLEQVWASGARVEYIQPENGSSYGGHFTDATFENALNAFGDYVKAQGGFQEAQY